MAKTLKDRLMERLPGSRTAEERPERVDEGNLVDRTSAFFQEFKTEMKKVTWPTKDETTGTTAVVVVTVLIIVAFLGVVDYALGSLVKTVLNF